MKPMVLSFVLVAAFAAIYVSCDETAEERAQLDVVPLQQELVREKRAPILGKIALVKIGLLGLGALAVKKKLAYGGYGGYGGGYYGGYGGYGGYDGYGSYGSGYYGHGYGDYDHNYGYGQGGGYGHGGGYGGFSKGISFGIGYGNRW